MAGIIVSFAVLQIDELYTRVRSIAAARGLWRAIDPESVSKAIATLHMSGPRTTLSGWLTTFSNG